MGVPGGFDPTLLPPRLQTRCGKSGRRRQFLPGEEEEEEEGRIDEKEASSKVCCSGSHFKGLLLLLLLPCSAEALLPEFLQYNNCFNSPPKFSGCMTNITADLGDNVVLTCQVSPRCHVQYVHWYHEPYFYDPSFVTDGGSYALSGDRKLFKTGSGGGEPYLHTIHGVTHEHLGKYVCEIANVMGKTECVAHLSIRSGGGALKASTIMLSLLLTLLILNSCASRVLR